MALSLGPVKVSNKRLLLGFPTLGNFSAQAIEIRENYGLGDTTVSEFRPDCGNGVRPNRDRLYVRIYFFRVL